MVNRRIKRLPNLTEEERKKLINFMFDVGFLYQNKDFRKLESDELREERIKTLISQGYRLMKFGDEVNLINLNGNLISDKLEKEMLEVYKFLKNGK